MKVLIQSFNSGFKKIASIDQSYFERQSTIIDMYQLLVTHFHLVSIRRDLKKKEKKKIKKIFGITNLSNHGGNGTAGFSEYASK